MKLHLPQHKYSIHLCRILISHLSPQKDLENSAAWQTWWWQLCRGKIWLMWFHFILTAASAGLKVRLRWLRESLHQHNKAEKNTSGLVEARRIWVSVCAAHPSLLPPVLSLKCCSLLGQSRAQPRRSLWFKSTLNSGQGPEAMDRSSWPLKRQLTHSTENHSLFA